MSRKIKPCGRVGIDLAGRGRDAERRPLDEGDDAVGCRRGSRSRSSSTARASRATLSGATLRSLADAHRGSSRRSGSPSRPRATAASSSSSRCSPTASSSRPRCHAVRGGGLDTRKPSSSHPSRSHPTRSQLGNPWYDAYHALASYLQRRRLRHRARSRGDHGPGVRGDAAAAGRRSSTRCTDRGPNERGCSTASSTTHVHLVAISDAQAAENPDVTYAAIVHNGIDCRPYPYRADKDDYLVYIGRANPDKGPVEAIRIARQAGRAAEDDPQARRAAGARVLRARDPAAARPRHRAVRERVARDEGRTARRARRRCCSRSGGRNRSGS